MIQARGDDRPICSFLKGDRMPAPDPGKAFHLTTPTAPAPPGSWPCTASWTSTTAPHLCHALEAEFQARPPLLVLDFSSPT